MGNSGNRNESSCHWVSCCEFAPPARTANPRQATWMDQLGKSNPGVLLHDLKMVAAHDAATNTIDKGKCLSSISRTQRISVYQQLELGVRMVDLRFAPCRDSVGSSNCRFRVYHGHHEGAFIDDVIGEIKQFSSRHPNEFIFVSFKFEKKSKVPITALQLNHWIETVHAAFSDISMTRSEFQENFQTRGRTLGQLLSQPKRILVTMHGWIMSKEKPKSLDKDLESKLTSHNIMLKTDVFFNRFYDTECFKTLFKLNDQSLEQVTRTSLFMVCQMILTPRPKVSSILSYIVCIDTPRADQKQKTLTKNKRLQRYIRGKAANDKWNFFMFDYVDFDPQISCFLLGLNYNLALEIKSAKVTNSGTATDITASLQQKLIQNNSLWVLSWAHDLDIKLPQGQNFLQVEIALDLKGKRESRNFTIPIEERESFLLNYFWLHENMARDSDLFTPSNLNSNADLVGITHTKLRDSQAIGKIMPS